jgi:hypothetical protein
MDTQEDIEALAPIEEAAPSDEVVGDPDKKEELPEPQTPRIPKKRAPRVQRPPTVSVSPPPPIADHNFWSDMIVTKRELDREATRSRYANLVKF